MALGLLGLIGCAVERPNNLGVREGILAPCPGSPNCVSSQAANERNRIVPLVFSGAPQFFDRQQILSNLRKPLIDHARLGGQSA